MKKLFFILLIIFCSTGLHANTGFELSCKKIDSLNQIGQYVCALDYINKLLNTKDSKFTEQELYQLNVCKLGTYYDFGMIDESIALATNLLRSEKLDEEYTLLALIRRSLGYELKGNFKKSFEDLNSALKLIQKNEKWKKKYYGEWLIRSASLNRVSGHPKKFHTQALEAEKYCLKVNDQYNYAWSQILLSFYYKNDFKIASEKLNIALEVLSKEFNNFSNASVLYNLARLNFKNGNYDVAAHYSDRAIANTNKVQAIGMSYDIFEQRIAIEKKTGHIKTALQFAELFQKRLQKDNALRQKVSVNEFKNNYYKLSAEFDAIEYHKNITLIVVSLSIFIFTHIIILFLFFKLRSKNKALKQLVKDRNFLLKELNHRVKNNLAIILSIISYQKKKSKDNRIYSDDLYQRINTIALAQQMLNSGSMVEDSFKIDLVTHFKNIIEACTSIFDIPMVFNMNSESMLISSKKATFLGIIINELVTNSYKHAVPAEDEVLQINIHCIVVNNELTFEYSDNGESFLDKNNDSSIGVDLINTLVKQLKGKVERNNSNYIFTIGNVK